MVGQRFVTHPLVRKVCFTGSTEVGKMIMKGCADQVKRCTLELGGKSANVIFADADVAKAAATAPYAVFDNAGQDCCARSRILVQESVLEEFLAGLQHAVEALVGHRSAGRVGRDGSADLGRPEATRCEGFLDEVDVAFAGSAPSGPGYLAAAVGGAGRPRRSSGSGARRSSVRWWR